MMQCYECATHGIQREAVGLCTQCSAGLCMEHAVSVQQPVHTQRPINQVVVLPLKTRQLRCAKCHEAIEQPR